MSPNSSTRDKYRRQVEDKMPDTYTLRTSGGRENKNRPRKPNQPQNTIPPSNRNTPSNKNEQRSTNEPNFKTQEVCTTCHRAWTIEYPPIGDARFYVVTYPRIGEEVGEYDRYYGCTNSSQTLNACSEKGWPMIQVHPTKFNANSWLNGGERWKITFEEGEPKFTTKDCKFMAQKLWFDHF